MHAIVTKLIIFFWRVLLFFPGFIPCKNKQAALSVPIFLFFHKP